MSGSILANLMRKFRHFLMARKCASLRRAIAALQMARVAGNADLVQAADARVSAAYDTKIPFVEHYF
jgi:hypothetical protein